MPSLGEKNHFDLVGALDDVRENLLRKITLREDKPIPLLTALDRLCAARGMRFGYDNKAEMPLGPSRFRPNLLTFAPAGISGPESDYGPFRVKVRAIKYILERTRSLDREAKADERSVDESCYLWL